MGCREKLLLWWCSQHLKPDSLGSYTLTTPFLSTNKCSCICSSHEAQPLGCWAASPCWAGERSREAPGGSPAPGHSWARAVPSTSQLGTDGWACRASPSQALPPFEGAEPPTLPETEAGESNETSCLQFSFLPAFPAAGDRQGLGTDEATWGQARNPALVARVRKSSGCWWQERTGPGPLPQWNLLHIS